MRVMLSCLLLVVLSFALIPGVASAASLDAQSEVTRGMGQKFIRGLSNSVLAITSYGPEVEKHGSLGLARGTVRTVGRTAVGAIELGTFFLPNPQKGGQYSYDPLIEPVHPWQT